MNYAGFRSLRSLVTIAAREAFTQIRDEHPEEEFYAFALLTNDDCDLLGPLANTVGSLQRKRQQYATFYSDKDEPRMWSHWKPDQSVLLEWESSYWEHIGFGMEHFDAPQRRMSELKEEMVGANGQSTKYRDYQSWTKAAICLGFQDLDSTGFFGSGRDREKVALFCTITNSNDARWYESVSVSRLNPTNVIERFRREWLNTSTALGPPDSALLWAIGICFEISHGFSGRRWRWRRNRIFAKACREL